MDRVISKTGQTFDIRLAALSDLKDIQMLNAKWTVSSIEIVDKEYGFLFCDTYKEEDLRKIIDSGEVAVAINKGQVVAYYINDNHSDLLDQYHSAVYKLKEDGVIMPELKVSLRTQIVVEKEFHRQGLPLFMLKFLKPHLISKYDILFSIGINENPKRVAHEKAGWEIIYEDKFNYFCVFDLNKID